jgi:DNA-binding XRE family transcriptional regulator
MDAIGFVKGLRRARKTLGLTASDLAIWFGRPRQTINTWLNEDHLPEAGLVLTECARRLSLLFSCASFPVPFPITKRERPDYIRQAFRDADNAGVPRSHTAAKRPVLRSGVRS